MNDRIVLDASVVVKWLLPEPGSDAALRVLERIRSAEVEAHVPDLLFAEVGNVLWKRCRRGELSPARAAESLQTLLGAALIISPIHELTSTAFEIAIHTQSTVYDGIYLALALQINGMLLTADDRLVGRLVDTEYGPLVGSLVH